MSALAKCRYCGKANCTKETCTHDQAGVLKVSKVIPVDSLTRRRPHIRHRAVINKVRRPYAEKNGVRVLDSELALTICGRVLNNFFDATDTSLTMTNGEAFAEQCSHCYGPEVKL